MANKPVLKSRKYKSAGVYKRRLNKPIKSKNIIKKNVVAIKETLDLTTKEIALNTMYQFSQQGFAGTTRALAMAKLFEQYRITKITFNFKPYYDTYGMKDISDSEISSVPYLYFRTDKMNSIPAVADEEYLKQLGVKGVRFDDKTLSYSFVPTALNDVNTGNLDTGLSYMQAKKGQWCSTDNILNGRVWTASLVNWFGCDYIVQATSSGGNPGIGTVEVAVNYEFKKPITPYVPGETARAIVVLS